MRDLHFSEQEIQRYADLGAIDDQLAGHLATCHDCQLQVANYKALFSAIHELEQPAFDFDVAALVLTQLPAPKAQYAWLPALAASLSVIFIATMAWVYGPIIIGLITGMSQVWMLIMVCPATIVAAFQGFALYKDYSKKISLLNLQDFAT